MEYTTSSRVVVVNFLVGLLHAFGPGGSRYPFYVTFLMGSSSDDQGGVIRRRSRKCQLIKERQKGYRLYKLDPT